MPKFTWKRVAVTYTVEGIPGEPITKLMTKTPGVKDKYYKTVLANQYKGRKVTLLSVKPAHTHKGK